MAEGERFCTKCGAPLNQAPAPSSAQQVPTQVPMGYVPPVPAPVPPKKKSSKASIVVIVIACIIIAAAIAVIVMMLLPNSPGSSSAATTTGSTTAVSRSAVANSNAAESSAGAISASAETGGEATPSSASATVVDRQQGEPVDEAGLLSDPEAYQNMNVFLSNFSEVQMQSIDVSTADTADLVRFALSHDVINSNNLIETAPEANVATNGAGNRMSSRESAERVNELIKRYMGTTANLGSLSSRDPYAYRGGYVYFSGSDVQHSPQGIANVVGSKTLGNGQVEVQFRVYRGSGYDATDEGLYALSADELMKRLGTNSAAYEGTAVVQTGGSNETTGGLTLVSYDVKM